jgi:transcriptional regulator with XRE-family HTH domain
MLASVNATALQEELRRVLRERIKAGVLTGLTLAKQTGFEQAHISNFLNRKRSLSVEGMDRILAAQNISVYDLLNREEINKRATSISIAEADFENVVLTSIEAAALAPVIVRDEVRDLLKFKKSFLRRLRPAARSREEWQRFVMVKVDAQEAASMYPRLLPGAAVLIDRHYNLLQPYRRNEANIYAVRKENTCTIKYVERDGDHLVLRPHDQAHPVSVLPLEGREPSELIVGRVCHVAIET